MLRIKVETGYLTLSSDINIALYLRNPMLNHGGGSFSFSFSIFWDDNNRKLLNYIDDLNNAEIIDNVFEAEMSFNLFETKGNIIINECSNENATLNFVGGRGSFNYISKLLYLTDLSYIELIGDHTLNEAAADLTDSVINYGTRNFSAGPVYMDNWGDHEVSNVFAKILNYWDPVNREITSGPNPYENQFSVFWFAWFVIEEMFKEFGYRTYYSIFKTDPELKKLHVFNFNTDYWSVGDTSARFSHDLPKIKLRDFINAFETKFCCTFFVYDNLKEVVVYKNEDIIMSTDYYDLTDKVETKYIIKNNKIKGYSLIEETDNEDNYIKDKIHQFDEFTVEAELESFNELPNPEAYREKIYYVSKEDTYYHAVKVDSVYAWEVYSFNLINKYEGEKDIEWITKATSMPMYITNSDDFIYNFYIPRTDVLRSEKRTIKNEVLKLLFYRGRVPVHSVATLDDLPEPTSLPEIFLCYIRDIKKVYFVLNGEWVENPKTYEPTELNVGYYPLFSSNVYYYTDAEYVKFADANYSLVFNGEYGLYEKFWKNYLYWLLNKSLNVKRQINYDHSTLTNIRWEKKIRIKSQNYLIKEIPINISLNEMVIRESELVKVY